MRIILFTLSLLFSLTVHANRAFTLATTSFPYAGTIPVAYTCDGKDISPALSWSKVPDATQSLALIISDADAPSGVFYHWIVYNIPESTEELPENISPLPTPAIAAKNSFGKAQYNGPCPPRGSTHTYIFTMYALDALLTLPAEASIATLLEEIKKHALAKTELTGTYHRN